MCRTSVTRILKTDDNVARKKRYKKKTNECLRDRIDGIQTRVKLIDRVDHVLVYYLIVILVVRPGYECLTVKRTTDIITRSAQKRPLYECFIVVKTSCYRVVRGGPRGDVCM